MADLDRIAIDPEVMMGKPDIRGTRVPVELILHKLSEGMSEADILDAYPHLTVADLRATLAYAAATISRETVVDLGVGRRVELEAQPPVVDVGREQVALEARRQRVEALALPAVVCRLGGEEVGIGGRRRQRYRAGEHGEGRHQRGREQHRDSHGAHFR